jgi:predicted ATP-grasp superfamily ATP-dependent carboligase
MSHERLIVAGVSTRAIADSAARAGFRVTALDAFGDLDQHPSVRALALPGNGSRSLTARMAARASRAFEAEAVAYLSPFDNHPDAVATLAAGRALWGNAPDVLRRVRNPFTLVDTLEQRGFATPVTRPARWADRHAAGRAAGPEGETDAAGIGGRPAWLTKPFASGGGHGISPWQPGSRVAGGRYLQELVAGLPGSVSIAAAAGRAVPLAVTRQLVGDNAFGATGYRYCGSILGEPDDPWIGFTPQLVGHAFELAIAIAGAFGLVGLNGIDFIAREDVPLPIEVNPRWCASMELVERAWGRSLFGLHSTACTTGELPAAPHLDARGSGAIGKAVVFSTRPLSAGDTRAWLDDPDIHDVPHPHAQVPAGAPICTVFAAGRDGESCYAGLVAKAARVYGGMLL